MQETQSRSHPAGLPFLFFTEMWERFGFYLLLAIFTLYLIDVDSGRGLDNATASDIYGSFLGLIYLTPFIGGLIADRLLGYRVSITIGAVLMGVGYMALGLESDLAFYGSLLLIIVGNGFFKPNISTLLGNLYDRKELQDKKDSGYNIFYMGINIGALVAPLTAAWLRNEYGWSTAFFAAGLGMFIGLIIFWLGARLYAEADLRKKKLEGEAPLGALLSVTMLPAVIIGVLTYVLLSYLDESITGQRSVDAFLLGALPLIIYYLMMLKNVTPQERGRLKALFAVMAVSIVFWAIFKQNGTALTYWAEYFTDRSMAPPIETIAVAAKQTQSIPFVQDTLEMYDELFRRQVENGAALKAVQYPHYFQNLPAGQQPGVGQSVIVASTEIFQSINPIFVVALTPVVIGFFALLRKRKMEPSTAAKIGFGMVLTALSALVMVGAVYSSGNGAVKSSAWWLIGSYGVITLGELFLSPMGLSLVSKLSPPRYTGVLMGGWFLSTAIGIKLSGLLASMWDEYDHKANFFLVNAGLVLLTALVVFLMLPWLRRNLAMPKEDEDTLPEAEPVFD